MQKEYFARRCKVIKGIIERIEEGLLRWFLLEEKERNRLMKRVYKSGVDDSNGSQRIVGERFKKEKGSLSARGFITQQACVSMVDQNEWR